MLLVLLAAVVGASALERPSSVRLPSPARWLAADGTRVHALLEDGRLARVDGTRVELVAGGLSPDAPIAACDGSVLAVTTGGELLEVEADGRRSLSAGAGLSALTGLLCAPGAAFGVGRSGDVLRLERRGPGWAVVARSPARALTDGQLALADLHGDGRPLVVALSEATTDRYRHGVLGDDLEPTAAIALDPQTLGVRYRLALPAPFVFEDLLLRPTDLDGDGRAELVTVRSGPDGGAALVALGLQAGTLGVRWAGPDFGRAGRWLNPLVSAGAVLAVLTPHIGGVLHRYALRSGALVPTRELDGVSTHVIGSRNLAPGVALARERLVLPSQDGESLVLAECSGSCRIAGTARLGARYSSNAVAVGEDVVIGDEGGRLHRWRVGP